MNKELGPIKLNQLPISEQLQIVFNDAFAIHHIVDPCLEVQLKVVGTAPSVIQYINNPCLEVQMKAVEKWGYAIRCIDNPCLEVQLKAVESNGRAIRYIDDPCSEVQMKAIDYDPGAIKYIDNPCLEVSELVDIIETSERTIYRNKKTGMFTVGCQCNISKEYFIWRIYNTEGGLEENPYRQEYLDILERY